jgi:diaminopimelate decarboxylase
MLTRDSGGAALLGGVPLHDVLHDPAVASSPGDPPTPAYVYDLDAMAAEARSLRAAFGSAPHLLAYAVKANTAGPIIRTLVREGCGAEVVSGGELAVALRCGVAADAILYSGVAKTRPEIDAAIGAGDRGILAIQIENVEEIARVEARARALGRRARVSVRINPHVAADTHAKVATGHDEAKFGVACVDLPAAWDALDRATHLALVGLSCHIGSQLTRTNEYIDAAGILLGCAEERERASGRLEFVNFGGGFGIDYGSGCDTKPQAFVQAALKKLAGAGLEGRTLVVEPGRALVGAHGLLCAKVVAVKRSQSGRRWLMIDAGMNDLVRPAMYGAKHRIEPLQAPPGSTNAPLWRVAGPVCESSDDFGEHPFAEPLPDFVLIRDAGAYGFTMASEYNGRMLPVEVFLQEGRVAHVIRPRAVDSWVAERSGV